MHETKETNSNQIATVQERTRRHQRKQNTHCIVLEKVFCGLRSRTTFAVVNKIKLSECSASV